MSALGSGEVSVSVPATSANLGPGFDALGLALDVRNQVTASVSDEHAITVDGEEHVPLDRTNLVHRSLVRAFAAMAEPTPEVRLHCENRIPHGRGLGSSSAAIVAGIAIARALVDGGDERLDRDAMFALAADIEGHPDNVAPAVFGGFTIAYAESGFKAARVAVDDRVQAVLLVPSTPVATELARGLLPDTVGHREAAANSGRAALLVAALTGAPELLFDATRDWLHQEFRRPAMPATLQLVEDLRRDGHAAVVSGAGPTVLVLGTPPDLDAVPSRAPEGWRAVRSSIDPRGVLVG